ncbi:MAG: tetratricopeptide repeat protein [Fimbriimonadaceae bacterium]|nr:tetratricopeptide repeat protein [Fimbriimonadaceae bacterium]
MVICSKCQTRNSLDSAFCKHCGEAADATAVASEKQKIEELVAEGFRLFNEGRVDEARLIAEKSIEELPEYTNALSLMGMCHERAGELNEALMCYEKIVEFNPDSALDKIKITQLRNMIAAKLIAPPEPSRRGALIGAFAATLLVISVGVALAGFISSQNKPDQRLAQNTPQSNLNSATNQNFQNPPNNQQNQPVNQQQPNIQQPNTDTVQQPNNSAGNNGTGRITPNSNVGEMPNVLGPLNPGLISIQPDNPPTGNNGNNGNTGNNGVVSDPNPPVTGGVNDPDVVVDPPTKPPKKTGVIEITVDNGNKPNAGGSVPVENNQNQMQALMQTARQQYLTGKYDLAAKTYEQALRAGADSATTNQRLGQCYEKLNRDSDAIQAYSRAVQAAQSQMANGGNKERLQNLIDSCQQAMRVLRGG